MKGEPMKVLLLEDNLGDVRLIREMLQEVGADRFEVVHAGRLDQGLKLLREDRFDVILLDLSLPDGHGVETLEATLAQTDKTPIVVLTGLDDEETGIQAVQRGGQDYMLKSQVNATLLDHSLCYAVERHRMIEELREANRKILSQQKSVIEEERLTVLLQMAGATAHELNQPLSVLLGSLHLMRMHGKDPEKIVGYMARIEEAAKRMSEIIKNMQEIHRYDTVPYLDDSHIINIEQKVSILAVEDSDDDFAVMQTLLKDQNQIELGRAQSIAEATKALEQTRPELILLDYLLPDGSGLDFLTMMNEKGIDIPVVVVTRRGSEIIASQFIKRGAYDYLPKEVLNRESLSRSMVNALEKSRLKREIERLQKRMAALSVTDDVTAPSEPQ
jgi:two-component system cell cycle response regulator